MRGEDTLPFDTLKVPTENKTDKDTDFAPDNTAPETTEPNDIVPTALSVDELEFTVPADGYVITGASLSVPVYSMTMNDHRTHTGVDISLPSGGAVAACADGVISSVYEDPMMGMTVTVDHGGEIVSVYRNLSDELPPETTVGREVSAGDVIAAVGNTALIECEEESHLHFELTVNGEYVDPLDYIEMAVASEAFEG